MIEQRAAPTQALRTLPLANLHANAATTMRAEHGNDGVTTPQLADI